MSAEILSLDAGALLDGYREGTITPSEVTRAALDLAEKLQPDLNAFSLIDSRGAMEAAEASTKRWQIGAPKGRLDGVPATVKDLLRTEGWPCRYGSHTTATTVMEEDAPVSARLREHGAVLIGATTTPEYGWKGVTDSPLTGITRNPWNNEKTPGGSSGGAAVAAAVGAAPLNVGTDGGGSIRIPAAFTGIFGLKPSFGLVPAYPASPFGTVSHVGPMTRTVRDAALMLTAITQPDPRNWHPLPSAGTDYTNGLDDGVEGLRIAFSPSLGGHEVDASVAARVADAARTFESLGAHVEEVDPPVPADLEADFKIHWYAGTANLLRRFDAEQQREMDPGLIEIGEEGGRIALLDYLAAGDRRRELQLSFALFHADWDLLLTPSMPITAFEAGLEAPSGSGQTRWIDWTPFSYPFNLTGQPAAAVPCGLAENGLPVSLQIVGALYGDALVLRAARAFEAAQPFSWPEMAG
jgi:aspartyl-tRNA(Asn)/glutamyl-tRNA(Gln) amidotransferase subunit A